MTGMDYDQAQSQLENDGLKVSLEFEDSDSVDKNEVSEHHRRQAVR